jgi:Na+-translocating ferredoxin:NAD+ oxidoreductase subunit B
MYNGVMSYSPDSPYRALARALDALPNRYPPAADESDLNLLACLFSAEEAALAAQLMPDTEAINVFAARTGRDPRQAMTGLKELARKGLITFGKTSDGKPGFALMPFVVGIYEMQGATLSAELARRFEDYFHAAFAGVLAAKPAVHRVIPVGEAVKNDLAVQPFETASALVDRMQSWGVIDCICRKQKALIGEGCSHPIDVCMVLAPIPDAFAAGDVRALTREEAHATLRRCAEEGLVHSVSNHQQEVWYICNCCTCSCGILRGMAELGIAGVVARSAFLCQVDASLCAACGECVETCSFHALSVDGTAIVDVLRCAGCGVCVPHCPQGALVLGRRPDAETPPLDEAAWRAARAGVSTH